MLSAQWPWVVIMYPKDADCNTASKLVWIAAVIVLVFAMFKTLTQGPDVVYTCIHNS